MAREVIEKLVDDLDGGEAAETVTFALDGTSFEIDLSKKNAAAFRKSFDRYIKAARRSSAGGARRRKAARVDERVEAEAQVRHHAAARVGRRERRDGARSGSDPASRRRPVQAGRRPREAFLPQPPPPWPRLDRVRHPAVSDTKRRCYPRDERIPGWRPRIGARTLGGRGAVRPPPPSPDGSRAN